jgi:hypothetical protein
VRDSGFGLPTRMVKLTGYLRGGCEAEEAAPAGRWNPAGAAA